MDEKTEELRDIFIDVTDEDTVTESQEDTRGSLADADRENVDERIEGVIESMRERYEFDTDLSTEQLCELVERFYDGDSDAEIARALDESRTSVVRARLDVHLVRDRDTDAPFEFDAFRRALADDPSTAELAERFDVSESTVRRYRRVVDAENESRQANDRYRDEFDSVLADADLSERITEDVQQDGLEDATEGMETDVSF
ncbi:conditioned medium-induced protein 4 [Natronoarchaeum rubrum]|uniref:conditioned medium-induced protein 4 n=1 Tax=Natronoarchaeum rubrum TaxID=755311 RepID=UPI0021116CFC|nr:conditioned medium-induced protein 4 [Natronoarchaeum rubrum]